MSKRILGVDPGSASGGFALYGMGDDDWEPKLLEVFNLPTMKSKGRGSQVNIIGLRDKLSAVSWTHAFIENVQARPQEGRGSGFKFGVGCGIIQGLVIGSGKLFEMVPPSVWKPKLGLNNDKDYSRTRAIQMFPEMAAAFELKKSHNLAESALIAYFGYMRLESRI